jgi:predicted Zn-ribbon and HTH transcriptional regulator
MSKIILIEGKKEDVAKKLKSKFEHDGPFIDRMLNVDPTGYKYVDYIARQLEKVIPELSGPKGGLNYDQSTAIYDVFYQIIPWFHNNFNKITSDDIWKTETKYRARHGVFDNINNLADNPKDINQYTNPAFLEELMEVVDNRKSKGEIEKELKNQAEKLYEDDDVLVVKPDTYAASCYYGANTKWCTTTKESSHYFRQYITKGSLYYFINKKDGTKLALFINKKDNEKIVYDSADKEITIETLRESFPNQDDLIDELVGAGKFLKTLRDFVRGKVSSRDLEDSDDAILSIREGNPLGQSIITIDFGDDEKVYHAMDLSDDDIWFLNIMNSYYSDYNFMDSYQVESDFKDGYNVYPDLDKENMEKMKQIASIIIPNKEYEIDNEEYRIELSKTLLDLFQKQMDYLLGEYHSEKEDEMMTTAKETVSKEMKDYLESIGFSIKRPYDELNTTPANLLMWGARLGIQKIDAISLFNRIVEFNGTGRLGSWAENSYEYQDDKNFDSVSFNRAASRELDDILEKLESDNNVQEFLEFRQRIESKYKMNTWYALPKDKEIKFKIFGFHRETMKVDVQITANFKGSKSFSLSEQSFQNLLYQPELFDLFGDME